MTQASHQTVRLSQGKHRDPDHGACVMELASMLAGEPFSDRPRCVDPVIAGFLRTYNDGIDERRRQDLYPLAAEVVGTRAVVERAGRARAHVPALGAGAPWRAPARRAAAAAARPLLPDGRLGDDAAGTLAGRIAVKLACQAARRGRARGGAGVRARAAGGGRRAGPHGGRRRAGAVRQPSAILRNAS